MANRTRARAKERERAKAKEREKPNERKFPWIGRNRQFRFV